MSLQRTAKYSIKKLLTKSRLLRGCSYITSNIVLLRYHSIHPNPPEVEKTLGTSIVHSQKIFQKQMEIVSKYYNPISMDDVFLILNGNKKLPKLAVAVTFDDGFSDNYEYAAPILNKLGIPATIYLTVNCIEHTNPPWFVRLHHGFWGTKKKEWCDPLHTKNSTMSNEQERNVAFIRACHQCAKLCGDQQNEYVTTVEKSLEVPPIDGKNLMLNWENIKKLQNTGHIIGSHTLTHPNLTYIDLGNQKTEIFESKKIIEEKLNTPITHFSYPNPALMPNYNSQTQKHVLKAGYHTAVVSTAGPVLRHNDPLTLKRMWVPEDLTEFKWYLDMTMLGNAL